VVTGLRIVVSGDVLVVLWVDSGLSLLQAESDIRATATRHGAISFFICVIFIRIVNLRPLITLPVRQMVSGETLPYSLVRRDCRGNMAPTGPWRAHNAGKEE
jgi:hypothetical protein